ncbi:MAG: hypothetical protein PHY93_12610 [Bacteriovorax sp.]|nr:hypothetical protein [Bacteriovorax sp.]
MKLILLAGLFLSVISIGGIYYQIPNATDAYLSAWAFWLQFPLGALGITLLHELTGGNWGLAAKPIFKAMMKCLWLAPLLFVPLVFKLPQVFPWLQDSLSINQNQTLKFKEVFYHGSFFTLRSSIYFILFLFINWRTKSLTRGPYMAAWGLCFYIIIMSFASIDWFMSRDPEWYSTVYSLIWIMAQVSSAFAVVLLVKFPGFIQLPQKENIDQLNRDQGTIFFVFLMTWAYLSFMQFLIVWSGNLPKEVNWYLVRLNAGWEILALSIIFGLLVLPFLLLNRKFKTNPRALALFSLVVLVFRYLDVSWIILPASRKHLQFSLWDLVSFIGIGNLSLWIFLKQLRPILLSNNKKSPSR